MIYEFMNVLISVETTPSSISIQWNEGKPAKAFFTFESTLISGSRIKWVDISRDFQGAAMQRQDFKHCGFRSRESGHLLHSEESYASIRRAEPCTGSPPPAVVTVLSDGGIVHREECILTWLEEGVYIPLLEQLIILLLPLCIRHVDHLPGNDTLLPGILAIAMLDQVSKIHWKLYPSVRGKQGHRSKERLLRIHITRASEIESAVLWYNPGEENMKFR